MGRRRRNKRPQQRIAVSQDESLSQSSSHDILQHDSEAGHVATSQGAAAVHRPVADEISKEFSDLTTGPSAPIFNAHSPSRTTTEQQQSAIDPTMDMVRSSSVNTLISIRPRGISWDVALGRNDDCRIPRPVKRRHSAAGSFSISDSSHDLSRGDREGRDAIVVGNIVRSWSATPTSAGPAETKACESPSTRVVIDQTANDGSDDLRCGATTEFSCLSWRHRSMLDQSENDSNHGNQQSDQGQKYEQVAVRESSSVRSADDVLAHSSVCDDLDRQDGDNFPLSIDCLTPQRTDHLHSHASSPPLPHSACDHATPTINNMTHKRVDPLYVADGQAKRNDVFASTDTAWECSPRADLSRQDDGSVSSFLSAVEHVDALDSLPPFLPSDVLFGEPPFNMRNSDHDCSQSPTTQSINDNRRKSNEEGQETMQAGEMNGVRMQSSGDEDGQPANDSSYALDSATSSHVIRCASPYGTKFKDGPGPQMATKRESDGTLMRQLSSADKMDLAQSTRHVANTERSYDAMAATVPSTDVKNNVDDWNNRVFRFRRAAASTTATFLHVVKPMVVEAGDIAKDISRGSQKMQNGRVLVNVSDTVGISPSAAEANDVISQSKLAVDSKEVDTGDPAARAESQSVFEKQSALAKEQIHQEQQLVGWSRLFNAASSTARSALKLTGPVIMETAEFCKEIGGQDRAATEAGTDVNRDGIAPLANTCQIPPNDAVAWASEYRPVNPDMKSIQSEATDTEIANQTVSSAACPISSSRSFRKNDQRCSLKEEIVPLSQTSATSPLTLEFTTGFVDSFSTKLHHMTPSDKNTSSWLRQPEDATLLFQQSLFDTSVSSSLSSPADCSLADLLCDSSFDEEFDDDLSNDVTMDSPLRQARPMRSDVSCWNAFMSSSERRKKTTTKDAFPADYVVMTSPRSSLRGTHDHDIDMTETDYSLDASISSGLGSLEKSLTQEPRSVFLSPLVSRKRMVNSASYSTFSMALSNSLHGSRHQGSSCATFPATEEEADCIEVGCSSCFDVPSDGTRRRPSSQQRLQADWWLSPAKKRMIRSNSRRSLVSRQSHLAPIFRNLCEEGSLKRTVNSEKSDASRSVGALPVQVLPRRIRRVLSMPALHSNNGEMLPTPSALPSSPTPDIGSLDVNKGLGAVALFSTAGAQCFKEVSQSNIIKKSEQENLRIQQLHGQREETLEAALVNFSSVESIPLPPKHADYSMETIRVATARWRQLVACWKHAEVCRMMLSRDYSAYCYTGSGKSFYIPGMRRPNDFLEAVERLDARSYLGDPGLSTLSSFLQSLTQEEKDPTSGQSGIQCNTVLSFTTVDEMIMAANEFKGAFTELVRDVVKFSSIEFDFLEGKIGRGDQQSAQVVYLIGTKDPKAIKRKASQKYKNDISRVSDVLRGCIIFPDGDLLLCALVRLQQIAANMECKAKVSISRLKNTFTSLDSAVLPTGYRHVLVNLCFDGRFIAELQLNLAVLYNVLGEHGPTLHRHLTDLADDLSDSDILCWQPLLDSVYSLASVHKPADSTEGRLRSLPDKVDFPAAHTLDSIEKDTKIYMAMLQVGGRIAHNNPRDVPSHFCLHLLLMHARNLIEDGSPYEGVNPMLKDQMQLSTYARKYLKRCLNVSLQSSSTGMTSWFEFGSNASSEVAAEQPVTMMYCLVNSFARTGSWKDAEHVLQTIMLRLNSKHSANRFHPIVLVAMLDLAAAAERNSKERLARRLLAKAQRQMSGFLAAMERMYLDQLAKTFPSATIHCYNAAFRLNDQMRPLASLLALVNVLQNRSRHDFLSILGTDDDVVLTTHNMAADALAISANCLSLAESTYGIDRSDTGSCELWRSSHAHYMLIYDSLFNKQGGKRQNAWLLAAYGAGRCLRETNRTEEAFQLLSLVLDESLDTVSEYRKDIEKPVDMTTEAPRTRTKGDASSSPFVPCCKSCAALNDSNNAMPRDMAIGYCQWLLAGLTADLHPEEPARCLRQLEASALSFSRAFKSLASNTGRSTRTKCAEQLGVVEAEMKRILKHMAGPR